MPTISEKILSRAAGKHVAADDFVIANIDYAMAHDGTGVLAVKAFKEMGIKKVWDPERIIIPFDHYTPAHTDTGAKLHHGIRQWVKEQGITSFFDIGEGICHQVVPENGFALPGKLIIGADSHSCTYGAFATGVGATDMAEIFASGKLWLRVPQTIRITVEGKLSKGVSAKDLTLNIIKNIGTIILILVLISIHFIPCSERYSSTARFDEYHDFPVFTASRIPCLALRLRYSCE